MKTTEIQATFVALLDAFEPITGQPTEEDLTRLKFACLSALVPIPFDRELGEHNLMGLLLSDDEYKVRNTNGVIFPSYNRPAIYDKDIATDATFGVRAKAEAIHKAKIEDWKTYDCARREVRNFIIATVEDTWIRELQDPITGYSNQAPRAILDHLWASCSGLSHLDTLALRDSMRTMHVDVQGIPEYINALKDTQKRSKRANPENAIMDHFLMVVATAAMLGSQRLPRADWKWQDLPKAEKTWAKWKKLYKEEEALERVRVLATDGQDQFGAAHRATGNYTPPILLVQPFVSPVPAPVPAPPAPTPDPTGSTQGEQLDEYFDALAAAATTDQSILAELVAANARLTKANEILTKTNESLVAKLATRSGGRHAPAGRYTPAGPRRLCPHCKKMVAHAPDDCFELEKNKDKRPRGWVTGL